MDKGVIFKEIKTLISLGSCQLQFNFHIIEGGEKQQLPLLRKAGRHSDGNSEDFLSSHELMKVRLQGSSLAQAPVNPGSSLLVGRGGQVAIRKLSFVSISGKLPNLRRKELKSPRHQ